MPASTFAHCLHDRLVNILEAHCGFGGGGEIFSPAGENAFGRRLAKLAGAYYDQLKSLIADSPVRLIAIR
jgi:hypothetical protein